MIRHNNFNFAFIVFTLIAMSLNAANGPLLIAPDAVGRSMGGTGVGAPYTTTNSMSKNPATLGSLRALENNFKFEFTDALIIRDSRTNPGDGETKSLANTVFAPSVVTQFRLNDKLDLGFGLVAIGGNVTDYGNNASAKRAQTDFRIARIPLAASYAVSDKITVGAAPFLYYGALSLNDDALSQGARSGRKPHSALGTGFQLGVYANPIDKLGLGLAFTSCSKLTYETITNFESFGTAAGTEFSIDDVTIEQPREIALGAHYQLTDSVTVAFDYRFIEWNGAELFKQLLWQHQHVFAFGAAYTQDKWALRAGLNLANNPISDITGEVDSVVQIQGHSVLRSSLSLLNTSIFPAYAKTHLAFGGGYKISDSLRLDSSFMYVFKETVTRSGTNILSQAYNLSGSASQWSVTLGLTWQLGTGDSASSKTMETMEVPATEKQSDKKETQN